MIKITNIKGQIYLIKMNDTNNNTFYKVGRTINFYKRNKAYNYADILCVISSENIIYDEKAIIHIFNNKCKLDKGKEFFISESDEFVLKIFIDYFQKKINNKLIKNKINNIESANTNTDNNKTSINIVKSIINNENKIIDNVKTNLDKIEDRKCTKCNKIFIYPSELKKHFKNTVCCYKSNEDIKIFFSEIKINKEEKKQNHKFKCDKCNSTFVQKCSLIRHINTTKCNKK